MEEPALTIAKCYSCGYDLRGHPTSTVCPECGVSSDFDAMAEEAVALTKRRRLLVLGPIAMLRKRSRAWWWGLSERRDHSRRSAKRIVVIATLIAGLFALTLGTTYIRVNVKFISRRPQGSSFGLLRNPIGGPIRMLHIDRLRGPFGEYRAQQLSSVNVDEYLDDVEDGESKTFYTKTLVRGTLNDTLHCLAIFAFWAFPCWAIPALLIGERAKKTTDDSAVQLRQSVYAALNYESPRMLYLLIAIFLTWPIELLAVWLDPKTRIPPKYLAIALAIFVAYNALSWYQSLRSDYAKVLGMSRVRTVFFTVGTAIILPGMVYGAYYFLFRI